MARVLPRARTVWRIKTWDNTKEEAFRHIHELVRMIIEELTARARIVELLPDTRVAVAV